MSRLVNWKPLAERLRSEIGEWIKTDAIREAFANTPRHLFIPRYLDYTFDEDAKRTRWVPVEDPDPDLIYSNTAFVTQVQPGAAGGTDMISTSSSSMPGLMADMIEELSIKPGMRVVEIGTGTGYNAAILCHIVGAANVATTDIDPELVESAKNRLNKLGYHPTFTPEEGSYDRLIATHAVDNIPYEWVRWLKPGGVMLADLRARNPMSHIAAWAIVTVDDNGTTATGKLLPPRGGFMGARRTLRHADHDVDTPRKYTDTARLRTRQVIHPKAILDDAEFEFFLWRSMPSAVWSRPWPPGKHEDPEDQRQVMTRDGRWTSVSAIDAGYMTPDDLWGDIELAYDKWTDAGKPGLDAYNITVNTDGHTVVELAVSGAEDTA